MGLAISIKVLSSFCQSSLQFEHTQSATGDPSVKDVVFIKGISEAVTIVMINRLCLTKDL